MTQDNGHRLECDCGISLLEKFSWTFIFVDDVSLATGMQFNVRRKLDDSSAWNEL